MSSVPSGSWVMVRYAGRSKLYPGLIARINDDGTFVVDYDDGEREENVQLENIVVRAYTAFAAGCRVWVQWPGHGTCYAGTIAAVNADGSYRVAYDDGEVFDSVCPLLVNEVYLPVEGSQEEVLKDSLRPGSEVIVRTSNAPPSNTRRGSIAKMNDDGTYEVILRGGAVLSQVRLRNMSLAPRGLVLPVGSAVMAKVGVSDLYFPGVVTEVLPDMTCCVFVFGHEPFQRTVSWEHVQIRKPSNYLRCVGPGTRVIARHRGGRMGFPGEVAAVNADGTYDVAYDDGDFEELVEPDAIELFDKPQEFKLGSLVWVNYRGCGRYYRGVVVDVGSGEEGLGLYDIRCDDGDMEMKVPLERIEDFNPAARSARGRHALLDVDSRVWARWRGDRVSYPGIVRRINGDGSYNIEYDDGEMECGVAARYVFCNNIPVDEGEASEDVAELEAEEVEDDVYVGATVELRPTRHPSSLTGVIVWIHNNNTYDIDVFGGESLKRQARSTFIVVPQPAPVADPQTFGVTDYIEEFKDSKTSAPSSLCCICLQAPKSAALLHGNTSHFVCCLDCSRRLKNSRATCPICRLPIDAVIKCFET